MMKKKSLAIGLSTALAAALFAGCASESATTVPENTSTTEQVPIERRANVSKVSVNAQGVETASGDIQVTKTTPPPASTQGAVTNAVRSAMESAVRETSTQAAALAIAEQQSGTAAASSASSTSNAVHDATIAAVHGAANNSAALALATQNGTVTTPYATAQPTSTPYAVNAAASSTPYVIAPSSAASATPAPTASATTIADSEEMSFGAAVISVPQTDTTLTTSPASGSDTLNTSAASTQTASESSSSPTRYPLLRRGKTSDAVTSLQEKLKSLGYLKGSTGYFGTDTEEALEEFQEANHLVIDGIAGNDTWGALLSGDAVEA